MRACDEGWPEKIGNRMLGYCPCLSETWMECQLGVLPDNLDALLPDEIIICPYAPILKLLAEAKEVKGPNDKSAMRYKTIHGDTMEEWESYTFWVRR